MKSDMRIKSLIAVLTLFFLGCATGGHQQFVRRAQRPPELRQFFTQLDAVVDTHRVQNAAVFKVPGFPYLRTDRFLAALGVRLTTDREHRHWVAQMQRLDSVARTAEINNLPDDALADLAVQLGRDLTRNDLITMVAHRSSLLMSNDSRHSGYFEAVKAAIEIPDEYSTAMRVVGLYPLTQIPVTLATINAYNEFKTWHQTPVDQLEVLGTVTALAPPSTGKGGKAEVAAIFDPANRGPLGLPQVTGDRLYTLASAHAPIIYQDVAAKYDRIGQVVWRNNRVAVDTDEPTVYYYLTYAFLNDRPVVQINYSFWFTERAGPNPPSIEKGPLDGITIRVNLNLDGEPVMVDIMNNCGCYFLFVPDRSRIEEVLSDPRGVDLLVPAWLPAEYPRRPLNLRINSGWHQVQQVFAQDRPAYAVDYKLVPYAVLESLPRAKDRFESVFNEKGIMKDSERIEPYIFFPMGIPKVGYMRQRGHHAIKLVGRAHFTDPYLHDENFKFN